MDRPDDREVREIYADALLSRGDPRGELIALELAGKRADAAALRRVHAATWWPELAGIPFATRDGFVERIHTPRSRLADLQLLFAREPVRELGLQRDAEGTLSGSLPRTVRRLATAIDLGSLAASERTGIEQLELTSLAVPGTTLARIRGALARDWPALHTLRIEGRLPAGWLSTVRDARERLPRLAKLQLHGTFIDTIGLAALRETFEGVEIVADFGDGPFALDLAGSTVELSRSGADLWRVQVDGAASSVRWRRMLERTGHVVKPWQVADDAPLEQLARAVAGNARRAFDRDELVVRLPTISQALETIGVVTYAAYDTVWELVETARIAYVPAARELAVTFLERHHRPDVDDEEALFD